MTCYANHFHLILKSENINEYPKIIASLKQYFSRNININKQDLSSSNISKREKGVWQRRYWEHTIRNEVDLYKHLDYIHYNPVKHGYVKNVKDWEFSSFLKFVKKDYYPLEWGATDDVKHIRQVQFE